MYICPWRTAHLICYAQDDLHCQWCPCTPPRRPYSIVRDRHPQSSNMSRWSRDSSAQDHLQFLVKRSESAAHTDVETPLHRCGMARYHPVSSSHVCGVFSFTSSAAGRDLHRLLAPAVASLPGVCRLLAGAEGHFYRE